jgi:diaminohydroxyphosphoribosylaminopyrimidine deaminase/5-amino-6-(5-phosphoribosylamino)uracil reductase
MNIGFIKRMQTGKPWVRMKIAASLDGKTALYNKQSQWITGEAARANGHRWRARACAILTGIGTVLDDNPQLTVRDIPTARQPMRIVVDSRLQTPLTAQLLKADTPVLIAYAQSNPEKEASLRAAGAEVIYLPNADGKVDLPALIEELGRREINELHVEAGAKLNGALIEAACVDELLIYLAPSLIGDALPMIELPALTDLALQRRLRFHHVEQIGEDLTILARFNAPL